MKNYLFNFVRLAFVMAATFVVGSPSFAAGVEFTEQCSARLKNAAAFSVNEGPALEQVYGYKLDWHQAKPNYEVQEELRELGKALLDNPQARALISLTTGENDQMPASVLNSQRLLWAFFNLTSGKIPCDRVEFFWQEANGADPVNSDTVKIYFLN